jgi:hypothetical protein
MKKLVLSALVISLFSTSAFAYDYKIVHDKSIGCTTEDDHSKLTGFGRTGDKDAFVKFFTIKAMRGECTLFNIGENVILVEAAVFHGMAKVRRRGDIQEFWTNMEYIKSADEPKRVEAPKPVEPPKELTPQQKHEIESKKCTDLKDNAEVVVCLNKLFSKK